MLLWMPGSMTPSCAMAARKLSPLKGIRCNALACIAAAVEGLMHLAPACTLLLLIGSALFEFRRIWSTNALAAVMEQPVALLGTVILGFFVNWLNYVVIKLSSALTLKVWCTPPR
jgi:hypothetical protein